MRILKRTKLSFDKIKEVIVLSSDDLLKPHLFGKAYATSVFLKVDGA